MGARLLTTAQAAFLLNCSVATAIRRLKKAEIAPALVTRSNKFMWRHSDVSRMLP